VRCADQLSHKQVPEKLPEFLQTVFQPIAAASKLETVRQEIRKRRSINQLLDENQPCIQQLFREYETREGFTLPGAVKLINENNQAVNGAELVDP
jgi:hypothetical protein